PEGGLGEYGTNLPHIIMTPSTLPWELNAIRDGGGQTAPWLLLLLLNEAEQAQAVVGTRQADDQLPVATLSLPSTLLAPLMPPTSALPYLSHVRQKRDANGSLIEDEVAVILGSRLAQKGNNYVYLIPVEGQYTRESFAPDRGVNEDQTELVFLKSWRFASTDPQFGFEQLIKRLNQGVIRLPYSGQNSADRYIHMGATLVPHHMRQGNRSAAWYRGPLLPGFLQRPHEISYPVRSADDLVRYNAKTGLFDLSYAVAWELGRLLMLNSKGVATDLYRWKMAHARHIQAAEEQIDHLPFNGPAPELDLPASVVGWFQRTARLEGIPFHNLIIDERLLPEESIRFFEIDWHWVEALFDGAFSIGRVTALDHHRERNLSHRARGKLPERRMTGFLLRSAVVAGHPDLLIDGYTKGLWLNEPETVRLFHITGETFGHQLSRSDHAADAAEQVIEAFRRHGQLLTDRFTIDQFAWIITDNDSPRYELIEAANGRLDIYMYNTRANSWSYVGQIESEHQTELNRQHFSKSFERAMNGLNIELNTGMGVIGGRWLLSDPDVGLYLIEHDVSGYTVYKEYHNPLLRLERLSKNVLIAIFEGQINVVDFHLKPDIIHHGVHADGPKQLYKYRRDEDGRELTSGEKIPVATRSNGAAGVLDISALARDLTVNENAGEFGLQMIEAIPRLRIYIGDTVNEPAITV
ncbi:MAG: hypothetical protein AAF633_10685, partial [Chloroflexota bacterium]